MTGLGDGTRMTADPGEVSGYLASKGWQRDGDWHGASVWRLGRDARILVPGGDGYEDTDELVATAVATIAKYESRSERDVWRDINELLVDAQYFRLHPDAPSGSISLPVGVRAAQGILGLMRAAATVVERGPHLRHEGRPSQPVDLFLHSVLLGAAVPGSYLLTTRVPTAPVGPQQLDILEDSKEFSGRAVAAQLHTGVVAARAATEQALSGNMEAFYNSFGSGVSANLCWALRDLGGDRRNLPFEIGFSWARGLPGQEPQSEITFTSAMPAILSRAGDELEALGKVGAARITGIITDLHDQRNEQPRIRVHGDLQSPGQSKFPRRAIWVLLNAGDYDRAIEAHRLSRAVSAQGHLRPSGHRLDLRADAFQVMA